MGNQVKTKICSNTQPRVICTQIPARDLADIELTSVQAFEILSNERRRFDIKSLSTSDDEITLRKLSEDLAAAEGGDRKTVQIALHQNHLPKLADYDVIEYNTQSKVILPTTNTHLLHAIITQTTWSLGR